MQAVERQEALLPAMADLPSACTHPGSACRRHGLPAMASSLPARTPYGTGTTHSAAGPWLLLLATGLALFACAKAPVPLPVADPATRRSPVAGDVVGFTGAYGAHVWRGLPYAEPPVGDLRFAAPRPAAPWSGTREALAFGALCPQFASRFGGADVKPGTLVGAEDCLTLNVFTPPFEPAAVPSGDARLPVRVWIHGGGNSIGTASTYEAGNLAQRENVVVVTINYRLGPLGWFRNPALAAGADPLSASGNYGTLDNIEALRWVKRNIAAFGGDPGKVTIFGESAGGANVYALLLSPVATGLFHRAIVESGGLPRSTVAEAENFQADGGDPASSSEILARLLVNAGQARCASEARTRIGGLEPAATARFLRGLPLEEFFAPYRKFLGTGMIRLPRVIRDGTVLPAAPPLEVLATGSWNRVPTIVGTNHDEPKLFMALDPRFTWQLLWVLPRIRDLAFYNTAARHWSDLWKASGADEPAQAMRLGGGEVWVYRFDWDDEPSLLGTDFAALLGAAHALEIPFVFGHFALNPQLDRLFDAASAPGRQTLSRAMMSYWGALARSGRPSGVADPELPAWPAGPEFMVLDAPEGGGLRLSDAVLREEDVFRAIGQDPLLRGDPAKLCLVLEDVLARAARVSASEAHQLAGATCPPAE